jgi:heme exporter protein A
MLAVEGLSFHRGDDTVFSGVGFTAGAGEVLQIHGSNGSGKTTLLRVLAGLLRPTAGTIAWNGADTRAHSDAWRRAVSYLGHANAVSPELTAIENLRFAARLGAAASRSAGDALTEHQALDRLGLAACENRRAGSLSQGQQRRIAIARLLVESKPVWLLDEPTAALDAESARLIADCIEEHVERGAVVVLTTHRPFATTPSATRHLLFERTEPCCP